MDQPFEKLKDQFEKIPEDVRLAISSVRVAQTLQKIASEHQLHIAVTQKLFDETGAIMLGLAHPSDYIARLEKNLHVDKSKAQSIASRVNEQIFRPIRESLKKIHSISGDSSSEIREAAPKEHARHVTQTTPEAPKNLPIDEEEDEKNTVTPAREQFTPQEPKEEKVEDTPTLDREQILREIEKPEEYHKKNIPQSEKATNKSQNDMIDKKLRGTFNIPREKNEYTEIPHFSPHADFDESTKESKKKNIGYGKEDPYREPIE